MMAGGAVTRRRGLFISAEMKRRNLFTTDKEASDC